MTYLRLAALAWAIKGLKGDDYAKLFDATIEGATKWAKQEDTQKCLKELGEFCAKRLADHLKPTKDYEDKNEKTDCNLPDPPCA